MTTTSFSQACDWIRTRQSIYPGSYTGEAASDEQIQQILLNANTAPSHRHTEPWRFHVVTPAARAGFKAFFQELYTEVHPGELYKERKYVKLGKRIEASSHILIINMQRDQKASVPEWEEVAAMGCAMQNIYLSLEPLGLGGYWSSPQYLIDNITDYIDLREGERCMGLFYIGVRKEEIPQAIVKRPIEEKVTWIRE